MQNTKMSDKALQRSNLFMALGAAIAFYFLMQDFYLSVARSVPTQGWLGYLTGPIFTHKVSELIIGGGWFFVAFMENQQKAERWPRWMPCPRYGAFLRYSAVAALLATVLATYAWTIVNLGTSSLTTDFSPLSLRPGEGLVWRYYLAAVIAAGAAYTLIMGRKGLHMGWEDALGSS